MSNNDIALSSLAMDLKRIALGFHSGSIQTAERFCQEALKRKSEVDLDEVAPYIRKCLDKLPEVLENRDRVSEDALMYSTIFQNYVVYGK